ncbi:HmuY family protein [Flavobacterium gelatinilyticum]|uniref:HmuY family protein n=1 Tax=Flavobacterium gelatinilyticum TaxID=3003260 RepID=UPI0024810326|nr:HmuY family protein [Flavobacterium gelatinilyticum]
MKTKFLKLSLLALFVFTASCSSDDDNNTDETPAVVVTTKASNIYAPQTGGQGQPVGGDYTRFSFSQNKVVTDDSWDVAFRGTTVIVNGGAKVIADDAGEPARKGQGALSIVSGTFAGVTAFPAANTFVQDAANALALPTGSGNGWYNYGSNNIISPLAGKVFVVKTHDGKYAKFEILSYYKDAPANPDPATAVPRYYTFNFAYQANSTTTF